MESKDLHKLGKNVKTAVKSCYGSISTRLVFTSKCMLPVANKDVLSTTQKSSVIYEYKCHCDGRYVGQTSQQQLQDRIKQLVQQWLRQQLIHPRRSQPHRSCKHKDTKLDCDSAIGQHLLENDQCALNYDKQFSILATACSSFQLNLLEAAYIKTRQPVL